MYTIKRLTKTNKENFEALKFVSKAMSKDMIKPIFTVMYVEKEDDKTICVGTDSRRLHLAKLNLEIEEGLYDVKINKDAIILKKSKVQGQFPNYKNVIPNKKEMTKIYDDFSKDHLIEGLMFDVIENLGSCSVNYNFIKDIVQIKNHTFDVYVFERNEYKPILFINEDKQAIIMPISTRNRNFKKMFIDELKTVYKKIEQNIDVKSQTVHINAVKSILREYNSNI